MIYAPLLLLIPVSLFSKLWAKSRRSSRQLNKVKRLNKEYFQGLNYLIENQPDKAIDEFVKLLEVDNETIEIHLTLASLFRSRGEVDRAIRIHQNIIARPNLARNERIHALSELGRDYLQAGVLDRAEKLFLEVIDHPNPQSAACLEFLLSIYEQERDWLKAINIAKKLQASQLKPMTKVIAQYYCELAESVAETQAHDAGKYLLTALKINPKCVRANLLLGDIYTQSHRYKQAIKHMEQIKDQNPAWIGETVDNLRACYAALKKEKQLIQYWESCLKQSSNVAVLIGLAHSLRQLYGDRESIEFLAAHMREVPSLMILSRLVEIYRDNSVGDALEKLRLLQGFISQLIDNISPYQCQQCGFSGTVLYWQCPGCRSWEVMMPAQWFEARQQGEQSPSASSPQKVEYDTLLRQLEAVGNA